MMLEPPGPHRQNTITLAAVGTAARVSRLFVVDTATLWALEADVLGTAELVASELVGNAVKATGTLEDKPPRGTPAVLIRLRLVLFSDSLFIEVWDSDPTPPVMKDEVDDSSEGGRGLFIVAELSKRWNYYLSDAGGKVVWAEIEVPPYRPKLPKRTPRTPTPPPSSATLRRVQDGLEKL